jgi:hypothetical protein
MVGHFDVLCGTVEHGSRITVDKLGYLRSTVGPASVTMASPINHARMTIAKSPKSDRAISKDGAIIGRSSGRTSSVS